MKHISPSYRRESSKKKENEKRIRKHQVLLPMGLPKKRKAKGGGVGKGIRIAKSY